MSGWTRQAVFMDNKNNWVSNREAMAQCRSVLCICGLRGHGKSTLASTIYNIMREDKVDYFEIDSKFNFDFTGGISVLRNVKSRTAVQDSPYGWDVLDMQGLTDSLVAMALTLSDAIALCQLERRCNFEALEHILAGFKIYREKNIKSPVPTLYLQVPWRNYIGKKKWRTDKKTRLDYDGFIAYLHQKYKALDDIDIRLFATNFPDIDSDDDDSDDSDALHPRFSQEYMKSVEAFMSDLQTIPTTIVSSFLQSLKFEGYVNVFKEQGIESMDQLKNLTTDDFSAMKVKIAHRYTITDAIDAHFNDDRDDAKAQPQHDAIGAYFNDDDAVPRVDNGLVMFFGAGKYTTYSYLGDIIEDEQFMSNVFEKKFKYRFISNCDFDKKWSKPEALAWIQLIRDKELIQNDELQYDALIFCGASHGSMHAVICSDGEEWKLKDIRSSFASNVNREFRKLPKIFVFNCCRTTYKKPRSTEEETRAAGYSVTITGTEGDQVFGSRLSRYVADAFTASYTNKRNVYDTLCSAIQSAKKTMELRLQEYDPEVGRVVFSKRPKGRGVAFDPLLNADDDLTNVLRPQLDGSPIDLFYKGYYDALFNAGFKTDDSLRTLTKDKLNDVGIKMVFHQKELLKRIARI
eukprot:886272_1